jgi:hypothetical protein
LLEGRCLPAGNVVTHWNELLLQSLSSQPAFQPLLTRNMALVHVTMFDAVNAIDRSYEPYAAHVHASHGASLQAAAAQAAYDTLSALYPARQAIFDAALAEDLAGIPPGLAMQGVAVGHEVAQQILTLRSDDGAGSPLPYTPPGNDPGQWHPTFPDFSPAAGAHIPAITPFAVTSSQQFRPPPPPSLTSAAYAAALNETRTLGSLNSPDRTADQTQVALLWRAPLPHFQIWNRVAQDVAAAHDTTLVESARLFAQLNMAINDGLETSFESKYHYALWRPVEAIRRADEDGNPATAADPGWTPLHPTTPPYPTYAGNAATIGAAGATVLAAVFGDAIPFRIDWGVYGFPGVTRSYAGFGQAAQEEADSRIWGGIHFTFDSVAGQGIGRNVAHYVMDNLLVPSGHGHDGLTADAAPRTAVNETLRSNQVPPLLTEALARWQAAGADTSPLRGIDVRVADLGGLTLGRAADGVVWLDDDAAGWGWYVDPTPGDDAEFTTASDQGEQGRTDLLTVLEHEIGHLLGHDHEAEGVMQETLTAGSRRTVSRALAADTGWLSVALTGLEVDEGAPWIGGRSFARGHKGA